MARAPRDVLGRLVGDVANLERVTNFLDRLVAAAGTAAETIPKIPKSQRGQVLKDAHQHIGTLMVANAQDYKDVVESYLKIQSKGGRSEELPNGRRVSENDFMVGLSAYCGLSNLIVDNGGDTEAVLEQCDERLGILQDNLANKVIAEEEFLMMLDAFQMDWLQDAAWRVKKWIKKTLLTKLKQLNADLQAWAERPPSKARQYIEERRTAREERKNWSFKKKIKWILGF